jgi:peptidoglycan/LPS O-acetylase OafA/YrhL
VSEQEYWFARRRDGFRRGVTPVRASGWYVLTAFVACMLVGGALFAYFMAQDRVLPGVVLYVLMVAIGAGQFIYFAVTKTDPKRTVADYRAMKPQDDLHDQLGGRR